MKDIAELSLGNVHVRGTKYGLSFIIDYFFLIVGVLNLKKCCSARRTYLTL